jgi:hypothetical protein
VDLVQVRADVESGESQALNHGMSCYLCGWRIGDTALGADAGVVSPILNFLCESVHRPAMHRWARILRAARQLARAGESLIRKEAQHGRT